ncbi:MAG TPA: serine/threonine protein kinase [Polyangiaceae bacterium]|nr:serine/threonine protein kinase [Polyangiaceae bacterium]
MMPSMASAGIDTSETIAADSVDWSEAEAQLTAAWDVRGIEIGTVQIDHKGTAVAGRQRLADGERRVDTLPSLLAPGPAGSLPQFRMGDILGEGGMGVVRLAVQTALGREVAVKSLKDDIRPAIGAPQLLREGRVTGVLEHPNVVPVYALGRDNADRPLLVMKRIAGRSWGSLLAEADETARRSDGYLREHLAILKQVALAIHYAHDKGIIHRDLKPENVMVGDFGEVYVVDWGIAVSLADADLQDVPSVREVNAIEGTPAYMSPEMSAGDGEHIDQRSDVYLLGAILHEILVGEPPHAGPTLMVCLTKAFASDPHEYPDWVPPELSGICHRAMARLNADRYPSAAAFSEAIDAFLEHWSSTELSRAATRRLERLRLLLAGAEQDDERHAENVHALFSECRFAFRQALQSWPDNDEATRGLQECLEGMIVFELARRAPDAASTWLRELPRRNPTLEDEVEAAAEKHRRTQERLAAIAHDVDLSIGQRLRGYLGLMLSVLYGLGCISAGFLTRSEIHEVTHLEFGGVNGALALVVLASIVLRRDTLLVNQANRRLASTAFIVFTSYASVWIVGHLVGTSMLHTAMFHSLMGIGVWSVATVAVQRMWWPIPVGSAIALVFMFAFPRYFFEWTGTFGVVGSILTNIHVLRSEGDEGPPSSRL